MKLFKPHSRLNVRSNFITQRVVNHWNNLPKEIVSINTVASFKASLTSTGTAQAMDVNKGLQPNNLLLYYCTCIHYANNNNNKLKSYSQVKLLK